MSIDICKKCFSYVDTDNDADCYQAEICICERCREKEEDGRV